MQTQAHSKARTRTLALLGAATLVAAVAVLLRAAFEDSNSVSAAPSSTWPSASTDRGRALRPPAEDDLGTRSVAANTTTADLAAAPVDSQPAPAASSDPDEVWALVAQLEALARAPTSFHAKALPVIERLTAACERRAERDASPGTSPDAKNATDVGANSSIWDDLLARVVRDAGRDPLVRGAVYLATATGLAESAFWPVFDEWLAQSEPVQLELVRAAALASTLKGEPSDCSRKLALRALAALPREDDSAAPGVYPLVLGSIAPAGAGAALRRWLDASDPRKELFRLGAPAPTDEGDRRAASDYFVTAELVFCVWAHQCLRDSLVERELVRVLLMEDADSQPPNVLLPRAAHFVAHSLAECNRDLRRAVDLASTSSSSLVKSLSKMMRSLNVAGLNDELLERIEQLRYATSRREVSKLVGLVVEAGESLGALSHSATGEREQALEYLLGLAEDPAVESTARGVALTILFDGATWDETLSVARKTLMRGAEPLYCSMAIGRLQAGVEQRAERLGEVLALLGQVASGGPTQVARELASEALAEMQK